MVTRYSYLIIFCYVFLISLSAAGAPFCLEAQGLPSECWYHDVNTCRQEAAKKGGYCGVNREEVALAGQGANFCIVESGAVPVCAYQSGESCEIEAARRNAVCVENTDTQNQDPYRFERLPFRDR